MRNFNEWLGKMRPSINNYNYYVDFEKVYANVENIRIELNIMNSLIGSKNIEADFTALLKRYPEILKCVPTLLAVRQSEIYAQDSEGAFLFDFNRMNYSVEQYMEFMRKTGLLDLIANHLVNNLVDYVLGIKTGLDSNGRKNRGGHQMEDLVEEFIKQTGAEYYKEMYITDIEKKWGVDLSAISAEGTSTKRWDFVVKTDKTIYVIETNFYGGGGSKLNDSRDVIGVEFGWVTDGGGGRSARRNLEETFNTMQHLYNINDMENGVCLSLFS